MKLKKIVMGAITLTLLVSCGNRHQTAQEEQPPYPTQIMEGQNAELLSIYPATIKGQEDIEIRPRIDGFIDAIYIDEGSVVKKGQQLFKINSPQAEQALTTAQASVKSAQARVNTAEINVKRIKPLVDQGIVSSIQLETVQDARQSAIADLEQAKATLKNAEATINWTNVSSPVDGFVGAIPFRLGSLVNSSNVLTTVANTHNVFVYFSLNEKELRSFLNSLEGSTQVEKISNIPEVTLTLADGTNYAEKGKVSTITGVLNITTGSANFRAEFPNPYGELKSGTSGNISIPRILKDVFVIPQKATFPQQDKILVYTIQGDSVMQKVVSVVSTPDGKNYAVTDGLKVGDRIVVDGIATLSNGKKIQIQ